MDKFLETHTLFRLNQEEIENLKRRITSNEIEWIERKKFPSDRSPGPDSLTDEFYQTFK